MAPAVAGCVRSGVPTGAGTPLRRSPGLRSGSSRAGRLRLAAASALVLALALVPLCGLSPALVFFSSRGPALHRPSSHGAPGFRTRLRAEDDAVARPPGADAKKDQPVFVEFEDYRIFEEGSRALDPEEDDAGEESESALAPTDDEFDAKKAETEAKWARATAKAERRFEQEVRDQMKADGLELGAEVSDAEVEEFLIELRSAAAVEKKPSGGVPIQPFAEEMRSLDIFQEIKATPQRKLLYERGLPNAALIVTLKDRVKQMAEFAEDGNWKRARYIMKGIWRRRLLRVPLGKIMWNLMIKAHMKADRPIAAESWMNDMLGRVYQPDHYSYNTLLQGYARRGDVIKVQYWMKRMRARGVPPDLYSYTALVNSHVTAEDLGGAERALQLMEEDLGRDYVNAVPYNAVLKLCAAEGDLQRAEGWFQYMMKANIRPDKVTHLYMIKVHAQNKDADGASQVLDRMHTMGATAERSHFHALMTAHARSTDLEGAEAWMRVMDDQGIPADVFSYNIILSSMASAGDVEACEAFVTRMEEEGVTPDVFAFGSMIQAHAQRGDVQGALRWIMTAEEFEVVPDMRCYNNALKACEIAGNSSMAEHFSRRMLRHSLTPDAHSYGHLLGAFAKDGNPAAAEFWIDHMQRSARWRYGQFSQGQIGYAYSQVLAAYVRVGNLEAAEAWLSQMLGEGVEPNERCYVELIRGHLEEGRPAEAQKWCTRMSSWSNHKVPEQLLQLCQGGSAVAQGGQPILEDVVG